MRIQNVLLKLALVAILSLPAFAQSFIGGNVYQLDNDGAYIQNSNGVTYVPAATATFRINNQVIDFGSLQIGTPINAYYQQVDYAPQFVPLEYYQTHRDWGWTRHVTQWQQDRPNWHNDNGHWEPNTSNR